MPPGLRALQRPSFPQLHQTSPSHKLAGALGNAQSPWPLIGASLSLSGQAQVPAGAGRGPGGQRARPKAPRKSFCAGCRKQLVNRAVGKFGGRDMTT